MPSIYWKNWWFIEEYGWQFLAARCEILSRRDVKRHLCSSDREAPNQICLVNQWSLGGSLQEHGWLWELLHRKSHPQHGGLRKGSSTEESHPQPIICVLKRLGEGRGFVGEIHEPLGIPYPWGNVNRHDFMRVPWWSQLLCILAVVMSNPEGTATPADCIPEWDSGICKVCWEDLKEEVTMEM